MTTDPTFDPKRLETWGPTLTVTQMAAIYQRTAGAIRKACQKHRFTPAPYKERPYLWRRVDVARDVEGARGSSLRRAS